MLIASNPGARKLFDMGIRDHIDLIIEIRQPADASGDSFAVIRKKSPFKPWGRTGNYLASRISYVYSSVITIRFIVRIPFSRNLPQNMLPLSSTPVTHQISFKFSMSCCSDN
jgi:hypothetical protein